MAEGILQTRITSDMLELQDGGSARASLGARGTLLGDVGGGGTLPRWKRSPLDGAAVGDGDGYQRWTSLRLFWSGQSDVHHAAALQEEEDRLSGKLVARFMPMALNSTFLQYMLLARPFLNSLLHARHGRQVDWLFRRRDGLAITSSRFADVLKAHTGQWGFPKGLKVATWRQLVAVMIRFHASSEAERRLLEREEA